MFNSFESVPRCNLETEKKSTSPEALDINRVGPEEEGILSRFNKGKAGQIARALTLLTSLIISSGSFEKVSAGIILSPVSPDSFEKGSAEEKKESPKVEQVEKMKTEIKEDYYHLEFQEGAEAPAEIIENIDFIYISVINNGEKKSIILSPAELQKSPHIKIDGYIANILIFSKREFDISLNNEKAKMVKAFEHKGRKGIMLNNLAVFPSDLKYEDKFFEELFSQKIIEDTKKSDIVDGYGVNISRGLLGGGYFFSRSIGISYYGEPVSDYQNNILTIGSGDKIYEISITQEIFQKFAEMNDSIFYYLGNNSERFLKIPYIKEKLQAVADGINDVEAFFNTNLVDRVNLIDYSLKNAFSGRELDKLIIFLGSYLRYTFDYAVIKSTAEHETLHKYVEGRKFTENKEIRGLFADLHGYDGYKKDLIINRGLIPFADFDGITKIFFAFINEKNFIIQDSFDDVGGHSQEDIWEFCTSFLHSLMYLDKLEKNLESQISIKKERLLTKEEKVEILNNYVNVLNILLEEDDITRKEKKFFKAKLNHVEKIKKKYEQQPQ